MTSPWIRHHIDQQSDDLSLILVTVSVDTLPEPERFVNHRLAIESRGNTFNPLNFIFIRPIIKSNGNPEVKLTMDNTSLTLGWLLTSTENDVTLTIEEILLSDPDTVYNTYSNVKLLGVAGYQTLELTLGYQSLADEPYPPELFDGRWAFVT